MLHIHELPFKISGYVVVLPIVWPVLSCLEWTRTQTLILIAVALQELQVSVFG